MNKYIIKVEELLSKDIEVLANSEEEALQIIKDKYKNDEIILDHRHLKDTSFNIEEGIKEDTNYKIDGEILYDLDHFVIFKDNEDIKIFNKSNKNVYSISRMSYPRDIIPSSDNRLIFVLGDYLSITDTSKDSDNFYQYSSLYYSEYLGLTEISNDVFKVQTNDDDIILVYIKNDKVCFKRVFDSEIPSLDSIIKNL